jgi:hypothetical protein
VAFGQSSGADAFLNVALGVVAFLAGIFMIGVIAAYLSRPVERL